MITKYQSEFTGERIDDAVEHALTLLDHGVTEKEKAALKLLAANAYVIDDVTGQTYKIGSENGKFYFVESDISVLELVEAIVTSAADLAKREEDKDETNE